MHVQIVILCDKINPNVAMVHLERLKQYLVQKNWYMDGRESFSLIVEYEDVPEGVMTHELKQKISGFGMYKIKREIKYNV